MRLFIAIDLPDSVIGTLIMERPSIEGIRWQDASQMHLTLRFIGDVPQQVAGEINSGLQELQYSSFTMDIKGFGRFPPKGYPRVFWAGIEKNRALEELQEATESVCREAGLEPERRPYIPHITLGKVKKADKNEIDTFINQHKDFIIPHITVDEFILYSSRLKPDGAVHTPEEIFSMEP